MARQKLFIIAVAALVCVCPLRGLFALDSDNDGMPDEWEQTYALNPTLDDSSADPDNDSLINITEYQLSTNPIISDTDNDGLFDGEERQLDKVELLVSSSTGGEQYDPAVAYNGTHYLVVWDNLPDDAIQAQLFNRNGAKVGAEFTVASYSNDIDFVNIGISGTDFIVSWDSYGQDGDGYGIYAQRVDETGGLQGSLFRVNTYTASSQTGSSVRDGDSAYCAVWSSWNQDGSQNGIYGQLYTTQGEKVGAEFRVNMFTANTQTNAVISHDGSNYLIVWQTYGQQHEYDIYARLLSDTGAFIDEEFLVNSYTTAYQIGPAIASIGGSSLITWMCSVQDGSGYGIFGRIVDNDGSFITGEFQINTGTLNAQTNPAVAACASSYVVCWRSYEQDGCGVYSQHIDLNGNKVGNEQRVNSLNSTDLADIDVASDGNRFFTVWQQGGNIHAALMSRDSLNTNPLVSDTDNDGLSDGQEVNIYHTDPLLSDTDSDGLTDGDEVITHGTNPLLSDTDDDGKTDKWEVDNGYDPLVSNEYDTDNDGLTDSEEIDEYGTNYLLADTDGDGLSDYDEILVYSTHPLLTDTDEDSVSDGDEVLNHHTNPLLSDTDNDGLNDFDELFDTTGTARVNITFAMTQSNPAVAYATDYYFVVWQTQYVNEYNDNIMGTFVSSGIPEFCPDFRINTYSTNKQQHPDVASNGSVYFVVWDSSLQDGYWEGIYGQFIGSDGSKSGSELAINTFTAHQQTNPSTASDGDAFFVTWESKYQDGNLYGIFARKYASDGSPIGNEFQVNTYTTSDQLLPQIASDGTSYLIVWQSTDQDGSAEGIFAQLIGSDGNLSGAEFQVNTYTIGAQKNASIASNGVSYCVTWQSETQDGDNDGIFAQLIDLSGNLVGSEISVNTHTAGKQSNPVVMANGLDYLVAWETVDAQSGKTYIAGQWLSQTGARQGTEFVLYENAVNSVAVPDGSIAGNTMYLAWQDTVALDIYGQLRRFAYNTDPTNSDTDNDGLSDGYEVQNGLNPLVNDTNLDSDNDGLSDNVEVSVYGTDKYDADSDDDGLTDGEEIQTYTTDPLDNDTDDDGAVDGQEIQYSTNPFLSDTDNDGLIDGDEINETYTNPLLADTDNDGLLDVEEVEITLNFGDEFLINSSASSNKDPSITFDGIHYIVAWRGSYNSHAAIFAQLFDTEGVKVGEEILVLEETLPGYSLGSPHISARGGEALIIWARAWYSPIGPYYDVYGRIINTDGTFKTSISLLSSYMTPAGISVASDTNQYLVVWKSKSDSLICGNIFDGNQQSISGDFLINTTTTSTHWVPSVACNSETYLVAWNAYHTGNHDVYAQLLTLSGDKKGSELRVNVNTFDNQYCETIASLGSVYLVIWRSSGLYGRILNNDGSFVTDEFSVNTTTANFQSGASACSDGKTFLVAWEAGDGNHFDILVRLLDEQGVKIGEDFIINENQSTSKKNPAVASDGDSYFVVWEDWADTALFGRIVHGWQYQNVYNPHIADIDNDGLLDGQEVNIYLTDPLLADTDNDALSDVDELMVHFTDPLAADTDSDGLTDGEEVNIHNTKPLLIDTDNDGIDDKWEIDNGYNPLGIDVNDADNDGLLDFEEIFTYGTDAHLWDTDNDSLSDYDEIITYFTDPWDNDTDDDRALDGQEIQASSNPHLPDTDNDGLTDGEEILDLGTSPLLADTDNDGLIDSDELDMFLAFGDEFRINTDVSGDQDRPSVVFDGVNYVVVWEDYYDYDECIFAQRYDRKGNKVGYEIKVYEDLYDRDLRNPSVSGIDGDCFIAWTRQYPSSPSYYEVYGRIMNLNGSFATSAAQLNSETYSYQEYPAIATDDTNYLVIWQSKYQDGSEFGIYGRLFDTNQNPVSSEFLVNSSTQNDQTNPAVDCNGNTYLVVWTSTQNGNNDIYAQLFSLNGEKIGSEILINSYTSGSQVYPDIAHINNEYIVVWYSDQPAVGFGIYGRLVGQEGNFISGEFQINTTTGDNVRHPEVASNGNNFLVVWQTENTSDISGQFLHADGRKIKSEFKVNVYTDNTQRIPTIASDGSAYFLAWESFMQDGSGYGIYGRIFGNMQYQTLYAPLNPDMDNDGLLDGEEVNTYGTDPKLADTDNDGFNDYDEIHVYGTSPIMFDTDNDALSDFDELNVYNTDMLTYDTDNDGLGDGFEINHLNTDPLNMDSDNDGLLDGEEVLPNIHYDSYASYSDEGQYYPSVATNGERYFVVWEKYELSSGYTDIHGRYFDMHGRAVSQDMRINTYTTNYQQRPAVTASGSGFMVAWQSYGQDTSYYGIYAQRFDSDGEMAGSEFRMNDGTYRSQYIPAICSLNDTYLAVWQEWSGSSSSGGDYGGIVMSSGLYEFTEVSVFHYSTMQNGEIWDGLISEPFYENAEGTWVYDSYLDTFVFDNDTGSDETSFVPDSETALLPDQYYSGSGYGVEARLFSAEGNAVTGELNVDEYNVSVESEHRIAHNGTNYMVVWRGDSATRGDIYDIMCQLISPDGTVILQNQIVNPPTHNTLFNPKITAVGSAFFVTWDSSNEYNTFGIYGRLLDCDGSPLTDDFKINTFTAGSQWESAVASTGKTVLVVWESQNQDGNGYGLYGQMFDAYAKPIGGEFRVNQFTELDQVNASLTASGDNYFAAWNTMDSDKNSSVWISLLGTSDPNNPDFDNDGLTDGEEVNTYLTKPFDQDTDGDGLSDYDEVITYSTDPVDVDMDDDGLSDGEEINYGTNPSLSDTDGDGFSDGDEIYAVGSDPLLTDSDNDGLPDEDDYTAIIGPEIIVNSSVLDDHSYPVAACNGSRYLVVWDKPSSTYLCAQFFDLNGAKIGSEFNIYSDSNEIAASPAITCVGSDFVVMWEQLHNNVVVIRGKRISSEGTYLSPDPWVTSYGIYHQRYPEISTVGEECIVSFQTVPFLNAQLLLQGQRIGRNWYGNQFIINTIDSQPVYASEIAGGTTNYLSAYLSSDFNLTHYNVYAQLLNVDGTQIGDELLLDQCAGFTYVRDVLYAEGKYVVLWDRRSNDGTLSGLFGQVIDGEGVMADEPLFLSETPYYYRTAVASAQDDNVFFTWSLSGEDFSLEYDSEVHGRFVDVNSGMFLTDEFLVNRSLRESQVIRDVATDGENYFVVWISKYSSEPETRYHIKAVLVQHGAFTDPMNPDSDNDGALDGYEVNISGTNPLLFDTDGDTMPDGWEIAYSCDPLKGDSNDDYDNDGLTNIEEYGYHSHPLLIDTDNDTLTDCEEVKVYFSDPSVADTDNDSVGDGVEIAYHSSPLMPDTDSDDLSDYDEIYVYNTLPNVMDTDNDGMTDGWEVAHNLNPLIADSQNDDDGDGVINLDEFRFGADPHKADTDNDQLSDYEEIYVYHSNPAADDPDGDGLSDADECLIYGTSATAADTDGDGYSDPYEINAGTDPLTPSRYFTAQRESSHYRIDAEQFGSSVFSLSITYDNFSAQSNHSQEPEQISLHYSLLPWFSIGVNINSDNDRMPDWWEKKAGTNPLLADGNADMDNDGLFNITEYLTGSNPSNPDTDGDGLPDGYEFAYGFDILNPDGALDADNDGSPNNEEYASQTDPHNPDTDGDGVPDGADSDPLIPQRLLSQIRQSTHYTIDLETLNSFGAGYSTSMHCEMMTSSIMCMLDTWATALNYNLESGLLFILCNDTDGDGMPNQWENAQGFNFYGDDSYMDTDNDSLPNIDEYRHHTNPHNADTDGDGQDDGFEVMAGTDADNDSSIFACTVEVDSSLNVVLCWPSNPDMTYTYSIMVTDDISTSPIVYYDGINPDVSGKNTLIDTGKDANGNGLYTDDGDFPPPSGSDVKQRFYKVLINY
ncbi:MAG: hypothetical protein AB1454_12365 [Candidatus Auribacterota bacterium]